jgi:hypothetical protein
MNVRYGRSTAFSSILLVLAILSAGCQPAAMQVSTVTPITVTSSTDALVPMPTATPSILSTSAMIQTPASTVTPGSSLITVPTSGPFRMVSPVDEVVSGGVQALVSTADGTLWLITEQDIAKIVGTTITVYLEDISGEIAGIDALGRVWVVNEDAAQISAWDGQTWTAYGAEAGWTSLTDDYNPYVRGGQSDLLGRIWFATSQDVRAFDGNQWTVYTPQVMGMGPSVYEDLMTSFQVSVLSSGMVWVTECDWGGPGPFGGRGIRWLDEGVWQGASSPVASGCAIAIAEDSVGRVWAGVDSILWRYDPASGAWDEFALPEPPIAEMRFGFIDSLAIDSYDTVWPLLVLCGGASCFGNCVLYHFHDDLWTQVGEVGEYDSGYWGPIFDAAGTPWLYWDGGIYRISGDSPELVSPLEGRIATIDNSERLWFMAPHNGREMLWVLDDETGD